MDKKIGIKKEFDNLGRIVIQTEMKKLYNIDKEIELVATPQGILLRSPKCVLVLKEDEK